MWLEKMDGQYVAAWTMIDILKIREIQYSVTVLRVINWLENNIKWAPFTELTLTLSAQKSAQQDYATVDKAQTNQIQYRKVLFKLTVLC